MNTTNNKKLTGNAKTLRKNMTKEERHLWYDFLKQMPKTVHRQKVIGKYIVDFYIAESKIVIEIDGSQHYEDEGKRKDIERDQYLNKLGTRVIRYSDTDINRRFEGVCEDIMKNINTSPPL